MKLIKQLSQQQVLTNGGTPVMLLSGLKVFPTKKCHFS